jgi:hypothetical protein
VLATGCVPGYQAADIEGRDLQSRYPQALEEARQGLARTVALADLLFAAWFAVDVARRGAGRHRQGGALLTAGGFVGVFTGAWLVTATAGDYPEGAAYEVAASAPAWVALAAIAAGMAWLVRGARSGPSDRGEGRVGPVPVGGGRGGDPHDLPRLHPPLDGPLRQLEQPR